MTKTKPKFKKRVTTFFLTAWSKWWVKTLLILALILIIIRIILSPIATKVANDFLAKKLHGYYGHVDCIHFAFYRGAYKVDSMYLNKIDSVTKKQTPFVAVKQIDLSVEWGALFHGKLVGELEFESPVVKFTKDKVEPAQVVKDTATFRKLLDIGMPLDINRFEIKHGSVRYIDENSNPKVDIAMKEIYVLAQNLRNTVDSSQLLPGNIKANAQVYGGTVDLGMKINILADDPTFDLKAEVKHLNLPSLNEFFKAYGKFTIDKGDFSVYSEVAAKDGNFKGYVKPIIKDLKVAWSDENETVWMKIWEGMLDVAAWILKNKNHDQLATKIPLEGSFKNPKPDIFYTIFELLRNGFIEALNPALDYEVNINSVGKKDTRTSLEKFKDQQKGRKEERKERRETAKEKKEKAKQDKEKSK